jgi:hypothetical protein
MVTRDGKTVAQGAQISNHLYRLDRLTVLWPGTPQSIDTLVFGSTEVSHSWDIWHWRSGHLDTQGTTVKPAHGQTTCHPLPEGAGTKTYTNYPKRMSGHFLDKVRLITQKLHIAGTNHWWTKYS